MLRGRTRSITNPKLVEGARRTGEVLAELLSERDRIVTDYGALERTGALVSWTSPFPGGAGLWQGNDIKGEPLPQFFPKKPFMFVAHNYDGSKSYHRMIQRGFEHRKTAFWETLLAYFANARIKCEDVFLTNVFMGLKTDAAVGVMEGAGPLFKAQCLQFFERQCQIVKPRLVVVMGTHAWNALSDFEPKVYVPHPSACHDATRRITQVPKKVAALVEAMASSSRFV